MKTIKIIELLNKIANGEDVPEKIKYRDEIFYYKEDMTDYIRGEYYYLFDRGFRYFRYKTETFLNDEIEIIEDNKKIEKIDRTGTFEYNEITHQAIIDMQNKIDELIDEINKLKEKE